MQAIIIAYLGIFPKILIKNNLNSIFSEKIVSFLQKRFPQTVRRRVDFYSDSSSSAAATKRIEVDGPRKGIKCAAPW